MNGSPDSVFGRTLSRELSNSRERSPLSREFEFEFEPDLEPERSFDPLPEPRITPSLEYRKPG